MGRLKFTIIRKENTIIIVSFIDAPQTLVFRVYTDSESIPDWFGPRNMTTVVEEMDFSPGGKWRFIQNDSEGNEFVSNGIYHVIDPPYKFSFSFEMEEMPGHGFTETIIFDDYSGKTKITSILKFQSIEDLELMVEGGMESGTKDSMIKLEEYLKHLMKAENVLQSSFVM